jgi:AraC-like DNA-binding protein
MVSSRCKIVVKEELKKLGLHYSYVDMGVADVMEDLSTLQHGQLKKVLHNAGLELLENRKTAIVEKIKNVIIEFVGLKEDYNKTIFSEYLSTKLKNPYTYLANLFSEVQGITVEKFIIAYKVERVKELIVYDQLNITEIAWDLHYSSVAHLSNQFRKVTGLSPSHFKILLNKRKNTVKNN